MGTGEGNGKHTSMLGDR